jgi:O-antigen/teichoic acid export membrane protein
MVVNGLGTLLLLILLRREITWIRYGVGHASWAAIRRLTMPAISFMMFPVVNALSLQGMLVVVGHVMGPIAVVIFSTARTISRSANQAMQLINNSVWPEMSAAYGSGDINLAKRLHRRACQISIMLCLAIAIVASVFGDHLWKAWTIGKIVTDPILLDSMLFQLVVSAFWYTSSVVPLATNKHQGLAKVLLGATLLSLVLAWLLMRIPALGLRGAAGAMVLTDVLAATYVLKLSLGLLNDTPSAFFLSMLSVPKLRRPSPKPAVPSTD